ncbi:MAG: ribosome small subunit-dependent GTPase A [Clostridiales Family XIII bacterium]|jgi:ribosome biogenesis GTPase|nr:ribosome small subunit-dependent GTPase A [Clostridiales Family XIII bacterium]
MDGLIVKGIGGFYYVKAAGGEVYQCRARGAFKKDGVTPTVGDAVDFEPLDEEEGVVNSIKPRKNIFIRPPIANIDCFVVIVAAARPAPNLGVLDKFLVSAERADTEVAICINKVDIGKPETIREIVDIYSGIYRVQQISCATGQGIEGLPGLFKGKRCALAGPSGAGKSTLLNLLHGGLGLETGSVSGKTERGRHTTRHVELFEMGFGGMMFDTPGFTSFEMNDMEAAELAGCYPEMAACLGQCRFDDCRHVKEPGCAVLEAVAGKRIAASRYASYLRQLEEISGARR